MALCETKTPPFILPCTVYMTILYCAAKLKSVNISLHPISRQTAKFNDHQYFQLYWYIWLGGWAWSGRSLGPYQKFNLSQDSQQRNTSIYGVCGGGGGGGTVQKGPGKNIDNTSYTSLFLSWVVQLLWYWM